MKLETQMQIAANLKALRQSKGISQRELAAKMGLDRSIYSLYENGRRVPDSELLYLLSKFFQVPMELLFETSPDKVVSEAAHRALYQDIDGEILSLFRALTPFSKGRLLEMACHLAEGDAFRAEQRKALERQREAAG